MLRRILFLSCGLINLAFAHQLYSQTQSWKQQSGPQGQEISGSAAGIHGDLYIVAQSGSTNLYPHRIWHTTNDGKDWEDVSGTLPLQVLGSITALRNGDLYAGEYWDGNGGGPVNYPRTFYRSRNNGQKWDTLQQNAVIVTISVAPNGVFYLDGYGNQQTGPLNRSLDSGRTWKTIVDPNMKFGYFNVSYFSFDSSGNVFVSASKQLWRSSDSGRNWMKLPTLEIFESPLQTLSNGNLVTYGTYNSYSGLWISTNHGMDWDTLAGNAGPTFTILPGDHLCAVRKGSVIFSDDLGKSWKQVTGRVPEGYFSETGWTAQFVPDGAGGCYYCAKDTIVHTSSTGKVLSIFQTPSEANVSAILIDDFGKMLFNGPNSSSTPAISEDGNEWKYWIDPRGTNCFDIWRYGKDSSGGLLAVRNGGLSRSMDSGYIWKELRHVTQSSGDIRFTVSPIGGIYSVAPDVGVLRTTDLGTTWVPINEFGINKIQMIETAPDGSVIVGADNEIFRSKDLYTSWEVTARLKDTSLHLNPNLFLRAASIKSAGSSDVIVGTDGDGAIRSTDNGLTWSPIRAGAENAKIYDMAESKNGSIYALAYFPQFGAIRVLYLPYHSPQWFDVSKGLGNTGDISSIAASHDGTVLIGTLNRGVYKLINELSGVPVFHSTGDDINLALSPNPASGHYTITYSLPHAEHVVIQLCDPLGRILATYANQLEEGGEHTLNASVENVANGMYYVRITGFGGSRTEKIVINK